MSVYVCIYAVRVTVMVGACSVMYATSDSKVADWATLIIHRTQAKYCLGKLRGEARPMNGQAILV